jgi:hypothetical protein
MLPSSPRTYARTILSAAEFSEVSLNSSGRQNRSAGGRDLLKPWISPCQIQQIPGDRIVDAVNLQFLDRNAISAEFGRLAIETEVKTESLL